jgi:Tol biopolymer transport system component/DNA-binding winged helix-turn-helix (wHTH) protein
MESGTFTRRLYRFGLYEADVDGGAVTRQGVPVKLQEQPFRILVLLLEARGELISREELQKKLWPEGTYVEFEGSLNTALMKLRAALNDNPDNPIFIETVPRKGYRFIAPIENGRSNGSLATGETFDLLPLLEKTVLAENQESAEAATTHSPSVSQTLRQWSDLRVVRLSAAALSLFVVSLIFYGIRSRPEVRVTGIRQITHFGQIDPWGRLVTDGSRVYFVVRDVSGWNLMQTSVEGGDVQRTPTPFDNTRIFDLSPDHSQFLIGQLTHRGEETPLWLWPVQGGAPQRLGDVMAEEAVWSPTGDSIAFVLGQSIMTSNAQGLNVSEISKFSSTPHSLVWSPDGKRFRFTQTDLEEGTDSMWEIGVDGKSLRRVLPEGQRAPHEGSGTWLAGGKYFAFSSGVDLHASLAVDTQANLWLLKEERGIFSRKTGDPIELTRGPIAYDHPIATPQGSRIYFVGSHSEYQLLRIDQKTAEKTAMLAESGATDMDFSLDGQWVVYAARENGTLWKSRIDGSSRVQLTSAAPGAFAPKWSPDQKQILFTGFLLGKRPRLYVVSAQGGAPKSVLPADNKWATVSGDWSSDGRQIVVDVLETGSGKESTIRILDLDNGSLTPVPGSEGLVEPRWSADGRYIAARNPRKKQIVLFDVRNKTWSVLAEANFPVALRWSPGGDALYYQDTDEIEQSVFRVPMANRESERVTRFGDLIASGAKRCIFAGLSPDGSVYVTVDHGDTDIYALDLKLP